MLAEFSYLISSVEIFGPSGWTGGCNAQPLWSTQWVIVACVVSHSWWEGMANQWRICSRVSRRFRPHTDWACQGDHIPGFTRFNVRCWVMVHAHGLDVDLHFAVFFKTKLLWGLTDPRCSWLTGISYEEFTPPCWVWWPHFCDFRETYCWPLGRPQCQAGNIFNHILILYWLWQSFQNYVITSMSADIDLSFPYCYMYRLCLRRSFLSWTIMIFFFHGWEG